MLPIGTILHPTDFSEPAKHALRLACSLARDHGAKLVLVHVVSPPAVAYGELVTELAIDSDFQDAEAKLDALVVSDPGLSVEKRVVQGDTVEQILRMARESRCDLVVLGTHGRTGLGRLLMGSVAEQVLRRAPCPVLTVKTPAKRTESREYTPEEAAIAS